MVNHKRVVCVLPAYNAAHTLARTLREVTPNVVDHFILVDDASSDDTLQLARHLSHRFPLSVHRHEKNLGYGANQKTCYTEALKFGADVVVMLHPDYQYEPKLLGSLVQMVASGVYDLAFGSRILGKAALAGGMPLYKYISNRALTLIENILVGQKLSEYHSGYRVYSRSCLETIPFLLNDDDFVFDNQILVQCILLGFRIGEISVPCKYFAEASSINFPRSLKYGLGVLKTSLEGFLVRRGLFHSARYRPKPTHIPAGNAASRRKTGSEAP